MRIPLRGIILLPLLLFSFALVGCSEDDSTPTQASQRGSDDYTKMDLDEDFGGLTATDEEEAFGDDVLLLAALADEGDQYEDELLADPEFQERERAAYQYRDPNRPGHRNVTFLRIKWGMLNGPVDENGAALDGPEVLDWTGALWVDRGLVVVRRVIRFERPFDHVVRPRLGPDIVAWVSHTGPHFDGLLVQIIEPPLPPDQDPPPEPNLLHFDTGPFSQTFEVAEVPDLDEVYAVQPEGNGIHFNGFQSDDLNHCPRGFLSGRWRPVDDDEATEFNEGIQGYFAGRWINRGGQISGFLRGGYGVKKDGERVFFGKYINRTGNFMGFVRGTWRPGDEVGNWSYFEGHWLGASGGVEGLLRGHAFHLPNYPGGFFEGRWITSCADETMEGAF